MGNAPSYDHAKLGHLYVIDGDLQHLAVDAWLLPTDHYFSITPTWDDTMEKVAQDRVTDVVSASWNGQSCVHLSQIDGVDVWLGDVGRQVGTPASHYVDCAREFVLRASERVRRHKPKSTLPPIVAIPHLGTGAGGGKRAHGAILQQLITDLTRDLNSGALLADIVLVAWGEQAESASQYFRSQFEIPIEDNPQWNFGKKTAEIHAVAKDIAGYLRNDQLSTFLGAGTSVGAGLPGWKDLLLNIAASDPARFEAHELKALGRIDDPRDQAAIIDVLIRRRSQGSLKSALQKELGVAKYSLQHGLIASLPCDEFITTNVDELFEIACRTNNKKLTVIPNQEGHGERWLLKLHGTISRPESMVFTRDDYHDSKRDGRALQGLVQAMLFTRHMLFVGYGLKDEDFHELLYEVRRAIGDPGANWIIGTAIVLQDEPLKAEIWGSTLRVVSVGTSDDLNHCARDAARFLDLVGMLAADKYRFFLDDHYNHELFKEDAAIAAKLRELGAMDHSHDSLVWDEIEQLLKRLGKRF